MSQRVLRSDSDMSKYEEMLHKNHLELKKTMATKEGMEEIKSLFSKLTEKIDYQERKISSLEVESSNHEERIVKLEDSISKLNDKVAVLNNTVDVLKKQSDAQEQYSRRSCLRINGIKSSVNESPSVCIDKVVETCKTLDIDIKPVDIDRAHRVGRDRKTMIVKLFSFSKRTQIYKARKKDGENVKIHLDLTKARLNLLDQAKNLISDDSNVDFVFADINCNTVARMKSNEYKFFDNIFTFKNNILKKE